MKVMKVVKAKKFDLFIPNKLQQKYTNMPCSICRQSGHNRSTCPQRNTVISREQIIQPRPPSYPPTPILSPLERRALTRKFWRATIKSIIYLKRLVKVSRLLTENNDLLKYCYFHWVKIRELFKSLPDVPQYFAASVLLIINMEPSHYVMQILDTANRACIEFHKERNPVIDTRRNVKLVNMRDENYLVYWVQGNIMIHDIDNQENMINYMGMIPKKGTFRLKTMIGHRFYLVPHKFNYEPPYHPRTDREFFIEPYVQINIHDKTEENIYIDDKDSLSELNRWKFNALKLDYLIRELIKLGARNNDVLDCVLDLHEDIHLDEVSEMEKDIAGIPSQMTNIT